MYQYPYGNAQQLNLDWILSKIQELEAGSTSVNIEEVANALVSASFDAGVSYRRYDYCFYNGKLYRALNDTSGAFNPSDWLEVVIGDDIPVLTRLLNAVDTSLTSLQNTVNDLDSDDIDNASLVVSGATVTDALETLNTAITNLQNDVGDLDSDDVGNASLVVSGATVTDALDTLSGAITSLGTIQDITSQITITKDASEPGDITNEVHKAYKIGKLIFLTIEYTYPSNGIQPNTYPCLQYTVNGLTLKTGLYPTAYCSGGATLYVANISTSTGRVAVYPLVDASNSAFEVYLTFILLSV